MSLGGLAISIGMIIDATIIQVENVQRHLSEAGRGRPAATVVRAVLEVRKPSHLRRAHHRPDLHPHHRPPGHRGEDVPAPGLHPCHRPVRLARPVAPRHPGLLLPLPQAAAGEEDRRRRGPSARRTCPLLRWSLRRTAVLVVVSLSSSSPARVALIPAPRDRVHADHGRGRLRHGLRLPARHVPARVARDEPPGRGAADAVSPSSSPSSARPARPGSPSRRGGSRRRAMSACSSPARNGPRPARARS